MVPPSTKASKPLRIERRTIRVPHLGALNPLPMLGAPLESPYSISGDLPREILEGSGYGYPPNLYPYQLQDGYDRDASEHDFQTVVLENERLRAVFLPDLGGRLWELVDKESGKNLLHTPSQVQFANLALRNAWFAGGIEWNIGTRGHSPTTCDPLHSGILTTTDGQQVLRMWEFERLREVVFQIDAWLPPASPVLYVAIRVRNPNDTQVPMYWWTNAAVPEDANSRVVAPAESAFASDYTRGIFRVDPTKDNGVDCTWPTNNERARDFFFDIPPERQPWILQSDGQGDGLAMLSSENLRGRKLFVWGQGPGGTRWQEWLNPDGRRYAEIQAGLAQTQFQHLAMPPGAEWSWVEAYGNARVDPRLAHSEDWGTAVEHCRIRLESLQDLGSLEAAHQAARSWADQTPQRTVTSGSGWGALESARRRVQRMPWLEESGTPFTKESISDHQQPWLDLMEGEEFSGAATYVKGPDWTELLERAKGAPALLHRAFQHHARGELEQARTLYGESLALEDDAQAHRGLALTALAEGDAEDGLSEYSTACALEPENVSLLIEALTTFLAEDRPEGALDLLSKAGSSCARHGRVLFLNALALARTGKKEEAAALLRAGVEVADLREGENSIYDLWKQVCPEEAAPAEYQFSMT
jgi:tetratricopeptide (TPR) repeat protein